jgi:hypothetical protein
MLRRSSDPIRWNEAPALYFDAFFLRTGDHQRLEQRVMRALALGEERQRLFYDIGLEMSAFLMRLEGGFVTEQFVEQELRRIFLGSGDQESFRPNLALRLGGRKRARCRRPCRPVLPLLPTARPQGRHRR